MRLNRREFIGTFVLGGTALVLSRSSGFAGERPRRKLVVVLLRGAADGLSLVVPYREKRYARLRPDVALGEPRKGKAGAALDLDGRFGLHPALEPLAKLYRDGLLAPVVAVGSPSLTRSHFDAQDYLETGTPDDKGTADGWLNRVLRQGGEEASGAFRAVALSAAMPRILQGSAPVLAMGPSGKLALRGRKARKMEEAFAAMYAKSSGAVGAAGREGLAAAEELRDTLPPGEEAEAGRGAPAGRAAQRLTALAKIAASEPEFEIGFTDLGGWDTHVGQGAAEGRLARNLEDLGRGLSGMCQELGPSLRETAVVVLTEFGRTVAQNGSGGTDHGHGSAALVLGGPIHGGEVHGRWPGLDEEKLHEGRDLAVTTDFRHVLAELLVRHLGMREPGPVFPGFATGPGQWLGLVRA
jgi:uncharacterized protein (DUF1501 family)